MSTDKKRIAALIVAAGRGHRAGAGLPKQYRPLAGRPVLRHTLDAFCANPQIDTVLTVIHPDDSTLYVNAAPASPKLRPPAHGGDSRAASVLNGIRAIADDPPDLILIHDAARPFISDTVIGNVINSLSTSDGALAMLPAVDAMRHVDADGRLGADAPRAQIQRAQTPQGFDFKRFQAAIEAAHAAGTLDTHLDDAAIALAAGLDAVAVAGDPLNFKLTTPEDFTMAERLATPQIPDIRHGQGFDVHAFGPGDHVMLCGVKVPHDKALTGHSDADVGLHALTDAILGGAAAGDIGRHFPPSDPQWKGADSGLFLRHAVEIVKEMGFTLSNADVTFLCERPKIGPHSEAMRARVADLCGIDISRVSVKATTTERLGFCGREEGIAAMAAVCLIGGMAP